MSRSGAKKGLLLYQELFDPLMALDDAQRGRLVKIAMDYTLCADAGARWDEPDFRGDAALACVWVFVRQSLDAAQERYHKSSARGMAGAAGRWAR